MKESEREEFIPHLEIKFDRVPRPIFVAALAPKLWKLKVPAKIQDLGYEDELAEVVKIYKAHYEKYEGHFTGNKNSAKFVGFRYYRSFDESILFDEDGEILQVDKEHIQETQANVRI